MPAECADIATLAKSLLGSTVTDKLSGILGQDVEKLAGAVQTGLAGSVEDMAELAQEEFGGK